MAEYIDRNKIPWAKVDNPEGIFWERIVFESAINNIAPADVIERSKVDNAIEEIIKYRDNATNDFCEVEVGAINGVLKILDKLIESEETDRKNNL